MTVRHNDNHTITYNLSDDVLYLRTIHVQPAYRGQGIATSIILNLRLEYDTPILLECHNNLLPFYERMGFVFKCRTYDGYNEMMLY